MDSAYPAPPWDTHGFSVSIPYVVRASDVTLPAPLEAVSIAGRAAGLLLYVQYRAPSPLEYDELVWMPCMTRVRGGRARGYHVAVMYVDHAGSLAGGREIWKLPKTLARFTRHGRGVHVEADDGTRLSLDLSVRGPGLRARSHATTLQVDGERIVRFRGDVDARARFARARVTRFESSLPAWHSFHGAQRVPGVAAALDPFHSIMQAPTDVPAVSAARES